MIILVDRAMLYRPQQTLACPRGRGLIVGNRQYRHRCRRWNVVDNLISYLETEISVFNMYLSLTFAP